MALGGERGTGNGVASYVSSLFDPFLNQVFVEADGRPEEAVRRLADRPGFVWMASEPLPDARRGLERDGFVLTSFAAMQADADDARGGDPQDTAPVGSRDEVASWHAVYSEVLGPDPRSLEDWQRLYAVLGPAGDASLWLWLLSADASPAATAALFTDGRTAGLYCFATREPYRRRGLARELVGVCRRHARRNGATRCVLQASAAGRPVYGQAGFVATGDLQICVRR
jgi:GNAT superfamily N-acetyltransferase